MQLQEDFDINEDSNSPDDDEADAASDDEDDSDRESVVGEETDPEDAIEDIIDEYNSDHSEIMDSWQRIYVPQYCIYFIITPYWWFFVDYFILFICWYLFDL